MAQVNAISIQNLMEPVQLAVIANVSNVVKVNLRS